MVTADFGPDIELTLFLRMHGKEIAKSLGKCIPLTLWRRAAKVIAPF